MPVGIEFCEQPKDCPLVAGSDITKTQF